MDVAAIVDAAHIEPWAKGQNDDPQNGLALCKNAHWAFDEGLWSVSDDWRILDSSYRLSESGPESLKLAPSDSLPIKLLLSHFGAVQYYANQILISKK